VVKPSDGDKPLTPMIPSRLRRLENEYTEMRELAKASSMIDFLPLGAPPSRYEITLSCIGLCRVGDQLIELDRHRFDLSLGNDFPQFGPTIVWKTPIFHPNILPPTVCTGDIWYPALSLADLVVSLCELVQYKSFNIYDPLDMNATQWLSTQLEQDPPGIPVDPRPVRDPEFEIDISSHTQDGDDVADQQ
jgi:ubiquitin-protein ligase